MAHPRAADALDGVTRWWLPAHLALTALRDDVEEALAQLFEAGLIERRVLPDGAILFVASAP